MYCQVFLAVTLMRHHSKYVTPIELNLGNATRIKWLLLISILHMFCWSKMTSLQANFASLLELRGRHLDFISNIRSSCPSIVSKPTTVKRILSNRWQIMLSVCLFQALISCAPTPCNGEPLIFWVINIIPNLSIMHTLMNGCKSQREESFFPCACMLWS